MGIPAPRHVEGGHLLGGELCIVVTDDRQQVGAGVEHGVVRPEDGGPEARSVTIGVDVVPQQDQAVEGVREPGVGHIGCDGQCVGLSRPDIADDGDPRVGLQGGSTRDECGGRRGFADPPR